jgi:hypothetical protein
MRNQTQEFHRAGARIAELVELVRRNEDGHARPQRVLAVALQDDPGSFQHKHFMLVGVGVFRRLAAGGYLELPHGKTGGGVIGSDQAAHATIHGPFRIDRRGFDLFAMDDFQGWFLPVEDYTIV